MINYFPLKWNVSVGRTSGNWTQKLSIHFDARRKGQWQSVWRKKDWSSGRNTVSDVTQWLVIWKWPKHWKESKTIRRCTDLWTYITITSTQLQLEMIALCPLTSQIYRCFHPRFCPNLFSSHGVSQVRYCAALPSRGPTWLVLLSYLQEPIRFWIGCIKW